MTSSYQFLFFRICDFKNIDEVESDLDGGVLSYAYINPEIQMDSIEEMCSSVKYEAKKGKLASGVKILKGNAGL